MKKRFCVLTAMLSVALALGMVLAGCDNGSSGGGATNFDGTWTKDPLTVIINGTEFIQQVSGSNYIKGIFGYTDTTCSFVGTHGWYGSWVQDWFSPSTFNYTLIGSNTLILSGGTGEDAALNGTWSR